MRAAIVAIALLLGCGDDARPAIYLEGGVDAGAHDAAIDANGDASIPPDPSALPGWLDRTRVHVHTRLWRVLEGTAEFSFAAGGISGLGARSFSRHVKTGEEDPWWPSAEPTVGGVPVLSGTADLLPPMVDSARAADMRLVGYYWHASDATVAEQHPEWVCRDAAGTPIAGARGLHLDLTSGHGDVVETRLVELAAHGFDGVYLDGHHLPRGGCFGTPLEAAFAAATGMDAASSPAPFAAFASARVAGVIDRWRGAVREQRADFAIIATASDLPGLLHPHARTELLRSVDAPKTELHLALEEETTSGLFADGALARPTPDVSMALGFAILRDASSGLPHVWAPGLPNAAHARGFVAAVTAWGGVATLDLAEELVLHDDGAPAYETTRPVIAEALAFGLEISESLASTRPTRFAAVHFPEAARDARADPTEAWRSVLAPTAAAFEALVRARVPAGIVTDWQLAEGALDGYRVLVLPAPDDLDDAQAAAVTAFRAAGGVVVEMDRSWAFADPASTDAAHAALRTALASALSTSPIAVEGGPTELHAIVFERPDGSRVVAIVNGIGWIQTHGDTSALDPSELRAPPPAVTDAVVVDRSTGRRLAVPPFDILALVEID